VDSILANKFKIIGSNRLTRVYVVCKQSDESGEKKNLFISSVGHEQ